MARRDLSNKDFSEYAVDELAYALEKTRANLGEQIPTVSAEEARKGERVVSHDSDRDIVRILFISQDQDLLNPIKQTLDGYLDASEVFDEVHILLLRQGIQPRKSVIRPHDNVFVYVAAAAHWWQLPAAGMRVLKEQLAFAAGFRSDLIVARDPYESASVALQAAALYGRPLQLHVLESETPLSLWLYFKHWSIRRCLAWRNVPRFVSIRTSSKRALQRIAEHVAVRDIQQLPQLNPYRSVMSAAVTKRLQERYPQYGFFLLFVGSLADPTAALQAMDAAQDVLRNRRICLILCGSGKGMKDCQSRAKALGIERQLVIDANATDADIVQYIKTAHVLMASNIDQEGEYTVAKAAAAGLPVVGYRTEIRNDLFTHQVSAMLVEPGDQAALAQALLTVMEDVALRKQLALKAQQIAQEELFQTAEDYRLAYRSSVEEALFVADDSHG